MDSTVITNLLALRQDNKWDQIVSSHFDEDEVLFIAWIIEELERTDQYGWFVRVRCQCENGHEWVRDTMRRPMELEVSSSHVELADVLETFTRSDRSVLADYCPVCDRIFEQVSERSTLAEQPRDLFVINLDDYAVNRDIFYRQKRLSIK
jgi:hypothetical protein